MRQVIGRQRGIQVVLALGALAVWASCSVSPSEERELGTQMAASTDSELPLLEDTMVGHFVTVLGRSMAARTSRADLDWHFAVVNTDEVNAFSLPGGFIYVDRALIEQADRFDELAGGLGHEIGHVVRRHSVKQIEETERRAVGVVLLCTLTRTCRHVGGLVALRIGTDAAAAQYSQRDESEADSEAVINTLRAGIDPEGLPAFLGKLLALRKSTPTPIDAFFATHPTDDARIAALNRQIAALGPSRKPDLVRDTPAFHAMQAHLRSLPRPPPPDTAANESRLR